LEKPVTVGPLEDLVLERSAGSFCPKEGKEEEKRTGGGGEDPFVTWFGGVGRKS